MFGLLQAAAAPSPEKLDLLYKLTETSIYIMGVSFIMGSLFTIFILLILDMMRLKSQKKEEK